MRIAFRIDASLQIGTGHVMRCLTLADALHEQGAQCRFICRAHAGHMMELIAERGYQVDTLPKPDGEMSSTVGDLAHASWLGIDWLTDAQETQQLLRDTKLDWLIVDHYALDHRWESALRSVCNRMMVIDDLADRRHDCDLLLDQNYGSCAERYASLVPAECTQLHGPEFALLKPIYAKRRAEQRVRSSKIERAFIYFGGGADLMNLTGMALRAFKDLELMKIELDIIVGSGYAHKEELETAAVTRGKTCIHTQLPDLSELMVDADLAIGAGGATTWERCCLGLPTIVISIADNQRPACEALAANDLIQYLGHVDQVCSEMIQGSVLIILKRPDLLGDLSKRGMKLVDGNGVAKVLQKLAHPHSC
jgi:UDP-2,4-diacetamido-2,4,6-trideoxy-beta-L-altropyranose hydrolase